VPARERYRSAAWLTRSHAITILPSIASLQGLRAHAKASRASSPMIGIGNPLLSGADGMDRTAWSKKTCADATPIGPKAHNPLLAQPPVAGSLFRGALANVDAIRRQQPLPETADELCAVARSVDAAQDAIKLGAQATETSIKELSRSGALAQYAIVHFATHGLVAGDLPNLAEPALMLTPPDRANEDDDGLLTASEITQLKLDADWVIMSACNTAAGNAASADALSGLARSFFYAGARSLLVSHWAVDSYAAVKLITTVVAELKANPKLGRADALRRSMLAMIDNGQKEDAHPSAWAPFVLVGEGAAAIVSEAVTIEQPKVKAQASATVSRKPALTNKPASRPRPKTKEVDDDWQSRVLRN
jgi:CHAT domain-containing protein